MGYQRRWRGWHSAATPIPPSSGLHHQQQTSFQARLMPGQDGDRVQYGGEHRLQPNHLRTNTYPVQLQPRGHEPGPLHQHFSPPEHDQRYIPNHAITTTIYRQT